MGACCYRCPVKTGAKPGICESLNWIKHLKLRLALINVCPVFVSSELLLSTHLPTLEGWAAELTVCLW